MSDNEPDTFAILPPRYQHAQRLNYHALNNGSDEEVPEEDQIFKKPQLTSQSTINSSTIDSSISYELILPEDSASQVLPNLSIPTESSQSDISLSSRPLLDPRIKPQNQWLWKQLSVNLLPGKLWQPKQAKRQVKDQEICCIYYIWKTTDSARATSTSNMRTHLVKQHGFLEDIQDLQWEDLETRPNQQSIATMFKKRTDADIIKTLEQNIICWSVINCMAFITETYQIIAIFLDIWTSKNSKAILGIIGYWLTADFKYKERVLEFIELQGVHSRENMAELLNKTLIELKIKYKLLTIIKNNTTNNETLVTELFYYLAKKFPTAIQCYGSPVNLVNLFNIVNMDIMDTMDITDITDITSTSSTSSTWISWTSRTPWTSRTSWTSQTPWITLSTSSTTDS